MCDTGKKAYADCSLMTFSDCSISVRRAAQNFLNTLMGWQSHKYWNRLCFVVYSRKEKIKLPHLPCLRENRFPCLVWHSCPSTFRRAGNSSSLTGILQSEVQEVLAVVRLISVSQSALSAVCFYATHAAGLVLTPHLVQDVPKDTVKSIICNTTVIIYFSSLEYVFVRFWVKDLFLPLSCFSLWTKAHLQCRNNGLLRVQFCPHCSHWQSSEAFRVKNKQFLFCPPIWKYSGSFKSFKAVNSSS